MNLDALAAAEGLQPNAKNLDAMSRKFGPDAARWAFTQWELRKRARAKFHLAERMLFDREGLEMATHERVANFHASLFPSAVMVEDLTCGLGSDLIALARRGPAVGYEVDPQRAEYAEHNLAIHDVVTEVIPGPFPAGDREHFFADPARRSDGKRRSFDANAYEPSLRLLTEAAQRTRGAVIKLSPLLPDAVLTGLEAQVVFVSFGRECREALALFGDCRRDLEAVLAYHVESSEWLKPMPADHEASEPLSWIYEMDPAAIRAHAHGSFGLSALGDSNGYLTGDEKVESPWLRRFRVLDHGSADIRQTRDALVGLNAATPVIKTRAPGVDPIAMRQQLKQKGTRPVVLMVWPTGKRLRHALVEAT